MDVILPIGIGLLGWMGGMLVNYLADVLPHRRRLAAPFCLNCQQLQPLANYFLWPRRCPHCGTRRGARIWLVEAVAVAASLWLWFSPPQGLGFLGGYILLIYFGLVIVMDVEYRVILHPVSVTGAVVGLAMGVWLHGLAATVFGGLAGFLTMLAFYYLGERAARWLARRRGEPLDEVALGFGDVNLAGVIGLMLGWPGILAGLFLGVLAAGMASLLYILGMLAARRYKAFATIPYSPFLVFGAVVLLYFRGTLP